MVFLKFLCNGLKGCWQVLWGAAYARAQGLPVTAFLALSAPFSGEANKLQSREGNECKSGLTSPDLLLPDFATVSFECFDFLLERSLPSLMSRTIRRRSALGARASGRLSLASICRSIEESDLPHRAKESPLDPVSAMRQEESACIRGVRRKSKLVFEVDSPGELARRQAAIGRHCLLAKDTRE